MSLEEVLVAPVMNFFVLPMNTACNGEAQDSRGGEKSGDPHCVLEIMILYWTRMIIVRNSSTVKTTCTSKESPLKE